MPPKLAAKCNSVSNQSLRVTKIMVIMRRTKKPKRTLRSIICNFEVIEEDYKWLFLGWGQGLKWAWASRSSTPAPYIISYYAGKGPRPQRDPEGALTPKGPRRGPDPKWALKGPRLQRGPRRGLKGVLARACGCGPAATLEGVFKLQTQCKFCHSRPIILYFSKVQPGLTNSYNRRGLYNRLVYKKHVLQNDLRQSVQHFW